MKDQKERLDYLVEAFIQDSKEYSDIKVPDDLDEKRRILRSLMNIRMPEDMDQETLKIQDEYLKERNREKGIVTVDEIPTIKDLGSKHLHGEKISIYQGDITGIASDAIVNAANSQMLGCFVPMHNCIDNCIHTYAGIQLRNECYRKMQAYKKIYGRDYEYPTAIPMLTEAYNLPCEKVIHVTGPIVSGSLTQKNITDLRNCYVNVLDLCKENGIRSVTFCCISTGVFAFPGKKAAQIAVDSVSSWLGENEDCIDRVIFNVFKDEDRRYYEQELL